MEAFPATSRALPCSPAPRPRRKNRQGAHALVGFSVGMFVPDYETVLIKPLTPSGKKPPAVVPVVLFP